MDIIVKNICRSFDDKKVLRNFSAVFKEGECTCIMGESGCGKTTLLNILMGLMPADSGEISGMPDKKSAVFQEDRLSPTLTAIRNVKITAGRISKHELIKHFERLNIHKSIHVKASSLSGGMKQRVAIIRAMLANFDILFLDEPFKGLDTQSRDICIEYIKEHTKGKTVIMVTHDIKEAQLMDAQIINM